jgi:hypothetical protein
MCHLTMASRCKVLLPALAIVSLAAVPAQAAMIITPTFTQAFINNFGANAGAAQNAWNAAAATIASNFSDNIHINITVDAQPGNAIFGFSDFIFGSVPYNTLHTAVVNDALTADDAVATGVGGSIPAVSPVGGATWLVARPQAKALGLLADDLNQDGITTFGAGNNFSFSGTPTGGAFDFQGIALHEITEVMGRFGASGAGNQFTLIDEFSYLDVATRQLLGGPASFSIDNGTTLLKSFNNSALNGFDTRDWAPSAQGGDGSPDAFNQFSSPNVINGLSAVDLRVMDVIGYDRVAAAPTVPEPSTYILLVSALVPFAALLRRRTDRD